MSIPLHTQTPQSNSHPDIRYDWQVDEIEAVYNTSVLELVSKAHQIHTRHFDIADIQKASLLSIKTGACPEDCAYCPQSAHHKDVKLEREKLMDVTGVLQEAKEAKDAGADRFCMGAAWREVRDGAQFDAVVDMVKGVREMGMEACVTLGMLKPHQAQRLADAGLTAYNHNLDTSPENYHNIITTRTFEDRIDTLNTVRDAGIELCTGGIIGMGESIRDRASMLHVLATMTPHPESVPINTLEAIPGTPLQNQRPVDPMDLVRMVATARITMPTTRVRLSAGRRSLTKEAQILCFMAGANSIFYGEKLLTAQNADGASDTELLDMVGANNDTNSAKNCATINLTR